MVTFEYCYFLVFGIFPSFIVEIVKKVRNIRKPRKGHLSLFFEMKSFRGEYVLNLETLKTR